MRIFRYFVLIFMCLGSSVFAQRIGFEEIEPADVSSRRVNSPEDYQGVYHFGESETEWELRVIFAGGQCYGQILSGNWDEYGDWVVNYSNLKDIEIQDNWLFSDRIDGEFVMYDKDNLLKKGFKLDNPQDDPDGRSFYEVGLQDFPIEIYYDGRFPQASIRKLTMKELQEMSDDDLKIMRNEIYARYGYRFTPAGAMDQYFSRRKWYRACHEDVSSFLSGLEVENIRLIRKVESSR